MRGLSTFSGSGWAHGLTFTLLPPQTLPQIWESCLKSYLMQVCKPCHYILAEAVEFFQTAFHDHVMHLWGVWAPSQDVDGYMASHSRHYYHRCFPRFGELAKILPVASVQTMPLRFDLGCRTFQTASHIHVIHTWGVWLPSQIVDGHMASQSNVTTTDTSPDLWESTAIRLYASVQIMPQCFGWGCRTFQTASHIHVIHIWGVWAPSQVLDGHMASHSHRYHQRCFPRFGEVGWNPTWCKFANHATTLWLKL
jgi:hypothetical protein